MDMEIPKDDNLWYRAVAELAVLVIARTDQIERVTASIPEIESTRRLRTLTEALDALDEAVKNAESPTIELGIKSARMTIRALMDQPMPPSPPPVW